MLKFNYKLSVKERVKAKCPRHPRYNPERDGRGGIVGTCTACYSLYDPLEARNKLDAAVREFVRQAVGCRQGTPQKEAAAARRSTGGGVTMPRRWSDVFTLISQRKAGHCGGKTTPANELTWEGTFRRAAHLRCLDGATAVRQYGSLSHPLGCADWHSRLELPLSENSVSALDGS
ncbi:MAG TPA: hypothetical protein VGM27_31940, partial [Acidobacteriaceae bacterium]